jgi:hypothetical protein
MEDFRIQKAIDHLNSILVEGESLIAVAEQHRLFTIFPILTGGGTQFFIKRRDLIAVTTGRFIRMKRNLLGGYSLSDLRWQDIDEASFYRGIFAADLTITKYTSTDITIDKNESMLYFKLVGFDIEKTQEIYKYIQKQEQEWREKRRIRGLEELRAKSGGINGSVSPQGFVSSTETNSTRSVSERLAELKKMYDQQLISDSEYQNLKAKIISEL